jgi:Surface adhesin CshA non-repetitive domain 2
MYGRVSFWKPLMWLLAAAILLCGIAAKPAFAQSCAPATTQGTAPAGWETYCWLNFSTYNDATARSAAGQNFVIPLTDGSTLSFNLRVAPTNATAFRATAAPSWTGAAVGNTAFLGIPGQPILYTNSGGPKSITFSAISITPAPGASAVSTYSFVAADAESTNNGENLQFITNGGNWTILDQVNPISGNTYPTISGTGTNTFTETGVAGTVGGYIVGSTSPTTVTANMQAGGLQGAMFAVRFASMRLRKSIVGARVDPADQFNFRVTSTTSGTVLASGVTSGTGNGPFAAAPLSLASGLGLTISETMAAGSASALSKYQGRLTCTNGNGSSTTPLPNNVVTTSYNFGALQFGDAVICTLTNTAFPHLRVQKALGSNRRFASDQFTVRINQGGSVISSATTTGTTNTITGGNTGLVQVTPGTAYTLDEVISGVGSLSQYNRVMTCTNAANGITTSFPNTVPGTITPVMGDVISCIITNTATANNARLEVTKTSAVLSDGVSAANAKSIPGARVRYTITVSNTGNLAVDANSIVIADPFPPDFTLDASTPMTMAVGNSGLSAFNQATMVTYSNQASGGAPYSAPIGSGYNPAITGLRFQPGGTMAAASASGPATFSFTFTGRID